MQRCAAHRGAERRGFLVENGRARTRTRSDVKGKQAGEKARRAEEEARKVVRRRTRDERPQSTQHRPAKIAWNTPGIYYPHRGGFPQGAARPPRWVKGSRTPEWPRRKRSVPVKSRTIGRVTLMEIAVAFNETTPSFCFCF